MELLNADTQAGFPATAPVPDALTPVSRAFMLHHRLCPHRLDRDGSLVVAVTSDSVLSGLDDLGMAYCRPTVTENLSPEGLELLVAKVSAGGIEPDAISGIRGDEGRDSDRTQDVRDLAAHAPVVRYINLLIREGFDGRASDIHLESRGNGVTVRLRVDGIMVPGREPPAGLERAVVSRIKLLADLDIADRRRPQDGRIRVRLHDKDIDVRVSTVPTTFGESVVLRLLDRDSHQVDLASLGMSATTLASFRRLAQLPDGLVLVTGPTGSGKSTTLYGALACRDARREKIVTLEDPVEYTMEGINQIPIHSHPTLTFASALRSVLRQDPDVVLVGEMRDNETAELAVQAALTGHAVLSTLHTADAARAIPRLYDLGVAPYLIAATLRAVLAQRLVRRVCDGCVVADFPSDELMHRLRPSVAPTPSTKPNFVTGRGCTRCLGTGYRGRVGLFDLVTVDDRLSRTIASRATLDEIRSSITPSSNGLRVDGWRQVCNGLTTIEEVLRVID